MEERFGMYRFIHLAFQEFLAARYLAEVLRREEKIVEFFQNNRIANSWWREVVLLTIGYLTMNSSATADNLIRQLAGLKQNHWELKKKLPPETQVASAGLAWSAVSEWPEAPNSLKKIIPDHFLDIFNNDGLFSTSTKRVDAGNLLGKLGDPRFRPDCWFLPNDNLLGFVEIPAGKFLMGNNNEKITAPQSIVELEHYFIARYPVTVAQFQSFVEASGYNLDDYHGNEPNHPVNGINWYHAMTYCKWLNNTLIRWPELPAPLRILFDDEDFMVCLPSEAEWEKAARGTKGRTYPWGEENPSPELANYNDLEMGTTPVGCFPEGASPFGLLDCAGNVWEWTRSLWGKKWDKAEFAYPYKPNEFRREDINADKSVNRIIRGGEYSDDGAVLSCARRDWVKPGYGDRGWGFRIALVKKNRISI